MSLSWLRAALLPVLTVALLLPAPASAQVPPVAPSSSPAPAPSVDPTILAIAKDWLHLVQTNTVDRSKMSMEMNALFTTQIAYEAAAMVGPLGDPIAFTYVGSTDSKGVTEYQFLIAFKTAQWYEFLDLDNSNGQIVGFRFKPVQ